MSDWAHEARRGWAAGQAGDAAEDRVQGPHPRAEACVRIGQSTQPAMGGRDHLIQRYVGGESVRGGR